LPFFGSHAAHNKSSTKENLPGKTSQKIQATMRILSCLFLGLNWQQRLQLTPNSCDVTALQVVSEPDSVAEQRNDKVMKVLTTAGIVGQVGSLASEADQELMEEIAMDAVPLSDAKPARIPLTGEHRLLYSAAKGASSGRVFGNVVGKVSQLFEDDEIFYNRVTFGPLQIALRAKREIKSDTNIKVSFLETSFKLFGRTIKKAETGGGGGE